MKSLTTLLPLTIGIGALVAAMVFVFPMGEGQTPWLIGSLLSAVIGALTLTVKSLLSAPDLKGTAALRALLTAQGLAFMLRLMAVGVGAFAMNANGLSPMQFVISFFVVSLAQQVLETRSLLSTHPTKVSAP
ncbi:MAG: hypothetical protein ACO1OB_16060 [Archangium sp.]